MSRNTVKFYLAVEGEQVVVRSMNAVGDASEENADKVEASSERQVKANDLVRDSSEKLHGVVSTLAGTIGVTGLAFGIADAVKAGEQWQLQQAQLANALKATGQYSKSAMDAIVESAEKMSVKGGYAGPEEIAAMTQFERLTRSSTEAIKLNQAAMNLARGANGVGGYTNAQALLERAYAGSTRGLQKYIGLIQPVKTAEFALTQAHGLNLAQLDAESKALGKLGPQWMARQEVLRNITPGEMQHAQALDKQATFVQVLQRVQDSYGKATSTFSHQTSGAISNLSDRFDLLGETIGKKVLPIVTAIVTFMSAHTTAMFIFAATLTGIAIAYGAVRIAIDAAKIAQDAWFVLTKLVTDITYAAGIAMDSYQVAVESATLAGEEMTTMTKIWTGVQVAFNAVMDLNPFVMIIAGAVALAAGFVLLYDKVKWFRDGADAVFEWLKGAVSTVVNFIGAHWKMLAVGGAFFLGMPFVALGVFIATRFGQIKKLVIGFVHDVIDIFKTLLYPIIWPFEEAYRVIKKIVDLISGGTPGPAARNPTQNSAEYGRFGFTAGNGVQHRATGGIIQPLAGGILNGFGGGDRIPALLESGEGILRKEAVQSIGANAFNAINATGQLPPNAGGGMGQDIVINLRSYIGSRVVAEETTRYSARRGALSGGYVSG